MLKKGVRRSCEVSPHMYFAKALWGAALPDREERVRCLGTSRDLLNPLHSFLVERAAP